MGWYVILVRKLNSLVWVLFKMENFVVIVLVLLGFFDVSL